MASRGILQHKYTNMESKYSLIWWVNKCEYSELGKKYTAMTMIMQSQIKVTYKFANTMKWCCSLKMYSVISF